MAVAQERPALAAEFHHLGRLFEEFLKKVAHFNLVASSGLRQR